jgi:hypothetical protein
VSLKHAEVAAIYAVHLRECEVTRLTYLRAAQAYMLISMPTGTSTIFGVFQAISALLLERDDFVLSQGNTVGEVRQ